MLVAQTHRYFLVNFARIGSLVSSVFHHSNGHMSTSKGEECMYKSSSFLTLLFIDKVDLTCCLPSTSILPSVNITSGQVES